MSGGDAADAADADERAGSDWQASREKSFRGISKRLADHYLQKLGGEATATDADGHADEVVADDWRASLRSEKVSIGSAGSLQLTEVTVAFEAVDEATLEDVVERFSRKAMRAGG